MLLGTGSGSTLGEQIESESAGWTRELLGIPLRLTGLVAGVNSSS